MARFTWHDLTITVGELNRARMFDCVRMFTDLLHSDAVEPTHLQREVDALLVIHAPASVVHNGNPLGDGKHRIQRADNDPITIELPMTPACFDALPASLATEWARAANAENKFLEQELFLAVRAMVTQLNSESEPDGDSSNATETATT